VPVVINRQLDTRLTVKAWKALNRSLDTLLTLDLRLEFIEDVHASLSETARNKQFLPVNVSLYWAIAGEREMIAIELASWVMGFHSKGGFLHRLSKRDLVRLGRKSSLPTPRRYASRGKSERKTTRAAAFLYPDEEASGFVIGIAPTAAQFAGRRRNPKTRAETRHKNDNPGDLRAAGVTRAELFERTATRQPIRVHDLRALFVTVNLANGKTAEWVTDRTGQERLHGRSLQASGSDLGKAEPRRAPTARRALAGDESSGERAVDTIDEWGETAGASGPWKSSARGGTSTRAANGQQCGQGRNRSFLYDRMPRSSRAKYRKDRWRPDGWRAARRRASSRVARAGALDPVRPRAALGAREVQDRPMTAPWLQARLEQKWPGPESNRRHADFQSAALPTELPGRPESGGNPPKHLGESMRRPR
jgi:hypothetical protein